MTTIILAGATGDLGRRIAKALVARDAQVRAIVRGGAGSGRLSVIRDLGAEVVDVDFHDASSLAAACRGASCVVSALSGLEDVIVGLQGRLLDAAVAAGVPRFIPSDFSLDYTALPGGSNRNFDLRRAFRARIDGAPIAATSIFNGAFADMLAGEAPLIVKPLRRVLYWGSPDTTFALTTKDDTAAFTAAAAADPDAPRDLRVAGTQASSRSLAALMSEITGRRYRPLWAGTPRGLGRIAQVVRALSPRSDAVFPAWQGMQYVHDMFDGRAPSAPIDNGRYPDVRWTNLRDVLSTV